MLILLHINENYNLSFLHFCAIPAKYLPEHRSGQRSISGDLQIIGGETAEPRKYIFLKLFQLVFKSDNEK